MQACARKAVNWYKIKFFLNLISVALFYILHLFHGHELDKTWIFWLITVCVVFYFIYAILTFFYLMIIYRSLQRSLNGLSKSLIRHSIGLKIIKRDEVRELSNIYQIIVYPKIRRIPTFVTLFLIFILLFMNIFTYIQFN